MSTEPDALPPRGATVVRTTGRMLPVRADGRVLLLRGWDPDRPEAPYWFSVGGGVEPGEAHVDAAVRELLEETGIAVRPETVSEEIGRHDADFLWAGRRIVQDLVYFAVLVEGEPVVSFDGLSGDEARSIGEHGWLSPDELDASGDACDERLVGVVRTAVGTVLGSSASLTSAAGIVSRSPPAPPHPNPTARG